MKKQVLFVQGGGAGVHDAWDNKLVESLKRELGRAIPGAIVHPLPGRNHQLNDDLAEVAAGVRALT